jgi:microcystin-dependent protein
MPWNGSPGSQTFGRTDGTRTGSQTWQQADAAGVDIVSPDHDTHDQDIADAINATLKKDGGNAATSNIPMGGFTLTNLAAATARTQPARFSDVQDGKGVYVPTVGGTANVITLTTGYSVSAYVAGQTFRFIAAGTNTGAVTIALDGLAAKDVYVGGSPLTAGMISAGKVATVTYDGTRFQIDADSPTAISVGTVMAWPVADIPAGWLECDGSAISRTTYSALFAVIGTTYGVGDGSTTFNIPNYKDYFLRGFDGSGTDAASRTDRGDGTTGASVGTKQAGETASHTHTGTTSSDGAHTHSYTEPDSAAGGDGGASVIDATKAGTTGSSGAHTHTFTTNATGGTESRPKNITVKWMILAVPGAALATAFSDVFSNDVQSTGRFGLDDSGGFYSFESITGAGSGLGSSGRFGASYSYATGTPGIVNSTLHAAATVAAGVADFVWVGLDILTNNATAGENVARYSQAIKGSTGPTWANVVEADDTTETANPTGALYAQEIDIVANGTDSGNTRRGQEIVGWRSNIAGADVQFAYGHRIGPSDDDVDHVVFKKGYSLTNGSGGTVSAFQVGIDLSEATFSTAGIRMGVDNPITWDTNGNFLQRYSSTLGSIEHAMNAAAANTVLFPQTLSRRTSGTAAAGIGVGQQFLVENDAGSDKVAAYISVAMSDVAAGSEDATYEFGLMIAGAAAASKLQMTGTDLRPMSSDGMALGSTAKMWSDLYLASGGVINFNNGNLTLTHSAGALACSGTFSASNVLSGTYTPTLTNTTNIDASTAFECHYIRVGTVVHVAGQVQVDATAAGSAATVLKMSLPVASDLANGRDLAGTMAVGDAVETGAIFADTTNNVAQFEWLSASAANHTIRFTFTYRVL